MDDILLTDTELAAVAGLDLQGIDDYERDIARAQLRKVVKWCEKHESDRAAGGGAQGTTTTRGSSGPLATGRRGHARSGRPTSTTGTRGRRCSCESRYNGH